MQVYSVAVFEEKGVDLSAPTVATCRIGMSACSLSLALKHAGVKDVSVYMVSLVLSSNFSGCL